MNRETVIKNIMNNYGKFGITEEYGLSVRQVKRITRGFLISAIEKERKCH